MIDRIIKRLKDDRKGTLAVEMAMATPVLVGLLLSGIEVTRYVLLNQKLERASATMADLVSQSDVVSEGLLFSMYDATTFIMTPFDLNTDGHVVVSSIQTTGATPVVVWQRSYGGGAGGSMFGNQGSVATLPAGLVVRDGEDIVTTEVFFNYTSVTIKGVLDPVTLHHYAVFRPRYGALTTVLP
jgi:Flp pilus assembly protein TadG